MSAAAAAPAPPVIYVDGRRQPDGARHVSALDRGLTLADGLFETMRAYGGRLFRLDAHLARLAAGAAALEIPLPATLRDTVLAAAGDAVAAGDSRGAAVRLTVTRGAGPAGAAPPRGAAPTVIVAASPLPHFPPALYSAGLTAHVASGRRNERAMTAGLKTLGYTDAVAALIEARRHGADDALFLDTEGHCSEAASSNLFVVTPAGALLTPPLSCGALPGITRAAVIELAAARGLAVDERPVAPSELLGAREAFLTSSLREIAPLVRLDGAAIGGGAPGPLTRDLAAAFQALVRRECAA